VLDFISSKLSLFLDHIQKIYPLVISTYRTKTIFH